MTREGTVSGPAAQLLSGSPLSAASAGACFVKQSTMVSILKGNLMEFWILSLPVWSSPIFPVFFVM